MSQRLRFTTAQAADYASCSPLTVLRALEAGEMRGGQRKAKGRWSIHIIDLDRWLDGLPPRTDEEARAS